MPTAYITAPRDAAGDIASRLVAERLAACVNAVDCRSTYRWEGEVHEDEEALLLAKTTDDRYDALVARVRELHPHEVPCIERIEDDPIEPFAAWRADSVGSGTEARAGSEPGSEPDADG
jgi:periplasmic divalent cation tolerance protein